MTKHDRKPVPEGDAESLSETESAKDSVTDELSPLEQADLRRRLALEFESFQGGIEG
jgi:hypothetical protein